MSKHTPVPGVVEGPLTSWSTGGSWFRVATVPYGQPEHRSIASLHSYRLNGELVDAEANARFIARAVNSHDELIAALEALLSDAEEAVQYVNDERINHGLDPWDETDVPSLALARATLARAKE
jgi:hypothetical protein